MRKLSDFYLKKAVTCKKVGFSGQITGVFVDLRLRHVEYLIISTNLDEIENFSLLAPRSATRYDDDFVFLSNILCIKNTSGFYADDYVKNPIGFQVLCKKDVLGTLEDIYFNDTKNIIESLIVDGVEILPERVEKVEDGKVFLLPEGRKRVRRKEIIKPTIDYKVEIPEGETLQPVKLPDPLPVRAVGNYNFLLGRAVTSNIYGRKHDILIKGGTRITRETVFTAAKFDVLCELILNSKT